MLPEKKYDFPRDHKIGKWAEVLTERCEHSVIPLRAGNGVLVYVPKMSPLAQSILEMDEDSDIDNQKLLADAPSWYRSPEDDAEIEFRLNLPRQDIDLPCEGRSPEGCSLTECKLDLRTWNTFRIAVELSSNAEPSGIDGIEGMAENFSYAFANRREEIALIVMMKTPLWLQLIKPFRGDRYPMGEGSTEGVLPPFSTLMSFITKLLPVKARR